jgi:hypothetical protein
VQGRLYQLLDYYPSGIGHSRTFSMRYGIIGKVWRTGEALLENNLLIPAGSTPPTTTPDTHSAINMIMRDWGMYRREAEQAIKRKSYFCFMLIHDQTKVGVMYMDCAKEDSFVKANQKEAIEFMNRELGPVISKLLDDISALSLQIELERD